MKRKTIGLVIDWFSTQYHLDLLNGLSNKIDELDLNLICFEGGNLSGITSTGESEGVFQPDHMYDFDRARNKIFDLVHNCRLDGIIIVGSSVGRYIFEKDIQKFVRSFLPIPIVNIGIAISGVPSIIVDNKKGFRELIIHLITHHKCKHFAFIKGPDNNNDAIDRYNTFFEILKEYHIPVDNELIFDGDFSLSYGMIAAKKILSLKDKKIDAIVSCNDEMGIEVLQYLSNNGKVFPRDFAITGFDDIERCRHIYPSLTTVRQPIYETGQKAVEFLFDLIHGIKIPELYVMNTDLIIRESCGCGMIENDTIFINLVESDDNKKILMVKELLNDFLSGFNISNSGINFDRLLTEILTSYFESLKTFEKGIFLYKLMYNLDKLNLNDYYLEMLEKILRHFFKIMINSLTDRKESLFTHELTLQSITVVKEKSKQLTSKRYIETSHFKETILVLSKSILNNFDRIGFYNKISSVLPDFSIKNFYIGFFEKDSNFKRTYLDFIFEDQPIIPEESLRTSFETIKLLPDEFFDRDNRYSIAIEAFVHEDLCHGYFVTQRDSFYWEFYDQFYLILNNALQDSILFHELKIQKNELLIQKESLDRNLHNVRKTMAGFIDTMSLTVEIRDPYTAGHQKRVSMIATAIALHLNLPEDEIEGIKMAAAIHDLGKISIPSDILNKAGKITTQEMELIKGHSSIAYDILINVEFPWPIADIVYQHHERLDGSGYPRGIKGDQILFAARIIMVADVVDAMSTHRPHHPAFDKKKVIDEITINKGKLYDPSVVDACVALLKENIFKFE